VFAPAALKPLLPLHKASRFGDVPLNTVKVKTPVTPKLVGAKPIKANALDEEEV
jgi:hypothetical protein